MIFQSTYIFRTLNIYYWTPDKKGIFSKDGFQGSNIKNKQIASSNTASLRFWLHLSEQRCLQSVSIKKTTSSNVQEVWIKRMLSLFRKQIFNSFPWHSRLRKPLWCNLIIFKFLLLWSYIHMNFYVNHLQPSQVILKQSLRLKAPSVLFQIN